MKLFWGKIKEEKSKLQEEIKARMASYLAAAFGLVAALAWNEAIKGLIDFLFPLDKNSLLAKFIYAVLITVVVVIITFYFLRFFGKK